MSVVLICMQFHYVLIRLGLFETKGSNVTHIYFPTSVFSCAQRVVICSKCSTRTGWVGGENVRSLKTTSCVCVCVYVCSVGVSVCVFNRVKEAQIFTGFTSSPSPLALSLKRQFYGCSKCQRTGDSDQNSQCSMHQQTLETHTTYILF